MNSWKTHKQKWENLVISEDLNRLENDYQLAEFFQNILLDCATNGIVASYDYQVLRTYFLDNDRIKNIIPSWLITHRDLEQFWHFIKHQFSTYAERREYIWNELSPLLTHFEFIDSCPISDSVSDKLLKFDSENIYQYWMKALDRKNMKDYSGAITMARSLLESVCKHILDLQNIVYDDKKIELYELYKKTASSLSLHKSQHEERVFKTILGGCSAIVNGLGNLRNNLGDAHGTVKGVAKPAARHSELAVNLAGSMALFLIQTLEHNF
jgi:hypothetical protein